MPNVDQFESVFKAAAKPRFEFARPALARVALVTDLSAADAAPVADTIRRFLAGLGPDVEWRVFPAERSRTVEDLLAVVDECAPNLVVTWRNLHSEAWRWPHSLGRHLDVLTQATRAPVLVVPHPSDPAAYPQALREPRTVMAVTDHLSGDGRLVRHAAAFTPPGGTLVLTHVEDDAVFDRYMDVIGKIPSIDTENARTSILAQLLKEPHDYIRSCAQAIAAAGLDVSVVEEVVTGHRLSEYRRLVDAHHADLLVMNTKDEGQLAMHGLAYPIAVELRATPLLML